MDFIKKNLPFVVVTGVSLLAFIAGAYLAFAESGKAEQAEKRVASAKLQLNAVLNRDPAPTEANIEASNGNVVELRAKLAEIRKELQRGRRLTPSSDGIEVMASIQQFISDFQRKASENTSEVGDLAPVSLPPNFAFGFEQYINEAEMPTNVQAVPILDSQRQILGYLVEILLSANPQGITTIRREVRERDATGERGRESQSNRFSINPAISARVPGAVDTLAFSLTFTGYTESLRGFLNRLAEFELPIVVRSVEVSRAAAPKQGSPRSGGQGRTNFEALFGSWDDDTARASGDSTRQREAQKPVIEENVSTFTVILEFIEIVLPDETSPSEVIL